jgi:hypothetical protein
MTAAVRAPSAVASARRAGRPTPQNPLAEEAVHV